jgi:hypothetical protein
MMTEVPEEARWVFQLVSKATTSLWEQIKIA